MDSIDTLKQAIKKAVEASTEPQDLLSTLKTYLYTIHGIDHPVGLVLWVPVENIQPNDYNPNSVASQEMKLLFHSIKSDGYTQPIVTMWDPELKKYVIVDGFHRYLVAITHPEILESTGGRLPIVVINKDINDRMASTIRHNRARGKHAVQGMANMVFQMLENGWQDADICNELGMEPEELIRLKYITGFARLFENVEYQKAWETRKQIKIRQDYEARQKEVVGDQTVLAQPTQQRRKRSTGKGQH